METRWLAPIAAVLALAAVAFMLLRTPGPTAPSSPAERDAQVRAACSACHRFPPPEILPRRLWRAQIEHMAKLVDELPAAAAEPFSVEMAVAWYESRAPERLALEPTLARGPPLPLRFRRRFVLLGPDSGPGVATVTRLEGELVPGFPARVVSANMARGSVHLFSLHEGPHPVGSAGHPARVVPGDLDGDGLDDLVISDLGNPMPTEEPAGRVWVARNLGDGRFELRTLLEGVGRVADARPADLDGDGDLDLVVASFGFLRAGGIYVLHNESPGALAFRAERVSDRVGAVSVLPVDDLTPGSGRGFAAAFAQQHELVAVFEPRAGGGFEERILYRAPHPDWGTSHLEAVDLDGDGDLDFLLAHGDTLDDGLAFKPYHGVEWLENREGAFVARHIGALYGAHGVEAGDLDGDGDLDVVASGFLPQVQLPVESPGLRVDSLIWFERTPEGWIPWSIESDHPRHTGLTLVDLDGDGRLDIVAAINRAWDIRVLEEGPSLEIWLNRGPPAGEAQAGEVPAERAQPARSEAQPSEVP